MCSISSLLFFTPQNVLKASKDILTNFVRNASKKAKGSTRNQGAKCRPKHRGWKVQEGMKVTGGTLLATQRHLRFHPGLNVGFGKNGTLWAMVPGKVLVTCEKADVNWSHTWVQRCHGHRKGTEFLKNISTLYQKSSIKISNLLMKFN